MPGHAVSDLAVPCPAGARQHCHPPPSHPCLARPLQTSPRHAPPCHAMPRHSRPHRAAPGLGVENPHLTAVLVAGVAEPLRYPSPKQARPAPARRRPQSEPAVWRAAEQLEAQPVWRRSLAGCRRAGLGARATSQSARSAYGRWRQHLRRRRAPAPWSPTSARAEPPSPGSLLPGPACGDGGWGGRGKWPRPPKG